MTSSIKTAPYEILIRFNCEIGEKFGELRGASRAVKSYLVDDATGLIVGRIDSGNADNPNDFPEDQLIAYLGEQFHNFNTQLETAQAELKKSSDTVMELQNTIDGHVSTIEELKTAKTV